MPIKKIVFLVEDDAEVRKMLKNQLSRVYEVYEAADGEEAVSKVIDHKPDLVILDLLLPKLDGFKVLERIRTYPDAQISATPVIVLSNLWSQKDILQIEGLKVAEYFVKAHTKTEDVVKRVGQVLGS